ncbi:MAG: hypothetical protein DI628_08505 [Blastochloris viridis]|uniref:Uncharacterized protein n=1 Tax=Blastochloris viridis TaxID=1079 RepID=A0A6N4RD22_BLAVI|nr:MAG: hypothetical protein DI628_08505 [Blastochloris viridis]
MKQSTKASAERQTNKASQSAKKTVADKNAKADLAKENSSFQKKASVTGWIQDASLETSLASFGYEPKPGEREVEFSVAMRRRQEEGRDYAELRGRALIHASGNVLALAEASYVAEMGTDESEAVLVQGMYPSLRDALQSLLQMAGHTPPLPESLENAA